MKNKNGLTLIAHGSKQVEANQYIEDLAKKLMTECSNQYAYINCGFLQFANPNIEQAIEAQINREIDQIYVLPLFLIPGNHVMTDIPLVFSQLQLRYPDAKFNMLPIFGANEKMSEWIKACI